MPEKETVAGAGVHQTRERVDMFAALRSMNAKDLHDKLKAVHPKHQANADFLKVMGDIALNRIRTLKDKQKYLIKGTSEEKAQYKERGELAEFLPETPGLLGNFVGAVFKEPVAREYPDAVEDLLTQFANQAGKNETPLNALSEQAARWALTFGSVDAVLDHPADDETDTPYVTLYTPEHRLDWDLDAKGRYNWVKYHEVTRPRLSWSAERMTIHQYRIITAPDETTGQPGFVTLYRTYKDGGQDVLQVWDGTTKEWVDPEKDKTWTPVEYDFHAIPVVRLTWEEMEDGIGDPWVKPLVRADLKTFRKESDVDWDIFVHAHPWILAWLHAKRDPETGKMMKPMDVIRPGANNAYHMDPGGQEGRNPERMEYLAPLTAELNLQLDSINRTREQCRRLGGNSDDTMIERGAHPRSGVALAYEQAAKGKNFATLARLLEEFEWRILELVALETNANIDLKGDSDNVKGLNVRYPSEFDQRSADELYGNFQASKEVGSPTGVALVSKQLMAKLVGPGVSATDVKKMNDEITKIAEEHGGAKSTDAGTLNAQSLAVKSFYDMGDMEMVNALRNFLTREHGLPDLPDMEVPEEEATKNVESTNPEDEYEDAPGNPGYHKKPEGSNPKQKVSKDKQK